MGAGQGPGFPPTPLPISLRLLLWGGGGAFQILCGMGQGVQYRLSVPNMVLPGSTVLALLPPVSAVCPLNVDHFCRELHHLLNHQLVASVLEGICHGFKLGFSDLQPLRSAKRNRPSVYEHPTLIDELTNEVSLGRVAGPFASPPFPFLHFSSFRVIPKKGRPGKRHLIVDLLHLGELVCMAA